MSSPRYIHRLIKMDSLTSVTEMLWWSAAFAYAYCVMFDKVNFLPEGTITEAVRRLPGVPIPVLRLVIYAVIFETARVVFDVWWRVTDFKIVVAFGLLIILYSGYSLFLRTKNQRPQAPGLRKRAA